MAPALIAWFCVVTVASLALPGYDGGTISTAPLLPLYAVLGGATGMMVRGSVGTIGEALRSAAPAAAILAFAVIAGLGRNQGLSDVRGEPLYLYVGLAIWASWAVLLIGSALFSRARWSGAGGIASTGLVAAFGWLLFTVRLD